MVCWWGLDVDCSMKLKKLHREAKCSQVSTVAHRCNPLWKDSYCNFPERVQASTIHQKIPPKTYLFEELRKHEKKVRRKKRNAGRLKRKEGGMKKTVRKDRNDGRMERVEGEYKGRKLARTREKVELGRRGGKEVSVIGREKGWRE